MATGANPVSTGGAGGGGAEGMYGGAASNLDIIETLTADIFNDSSAPPPSDSDVTRGDGAGAPPSSGAGTGAEETKPEWFDGAPAEFKALFGQQNISAESKKWLSETYGKLHGFTESPIGTPEAVQELSEMFPGGIEDIRTAATDAHSFREEMEMFRSGDPEKQGELLGRLVTEDPTAFVALMQGGADMLKQTLRDDYTSFAQGVAKDHLETITDGQFAPFFNAISKISTDYNALAESNPAEAQKMVGKLASLALQMGDWWGVAHKKLGYGEQAAGAAPVRIPGQRTPVANRGDDQRELAIAQRESNFYVSNYILKHDASVNPMIATSMRAELTARKMTDLPASYLNKIAAKVGQGVKDLIGKDKTFAALEDRLYYRGSRNDPRKWNNDPKTADQLIAHAKQRVAKMLPNLIKQELDEVQLLRGGAARKETQPGAEVRGGRVSSPAGGGGGASNWETDLKEGKISSAEAIARIAG